MTPIKMPELVATLVDDGRWGDIDLGRLAQRAATAVLGHLRLDPAAYEISLLGCNDTRITELNTDFRAKPRPTNVLSWPAQERAVATPGGIPDLPEAGSAAMPQELGDIAIAYDTCVREADAAKMSLPEHVTHLLAHATLHLLGYDHIHDEDAALMQGLETEILALLGQADPYRVD